jgi:hypothetical protein
VTCVSSPKPRLGIRHPLLDGDLFLGSRKCKVGSRGFFCMKPHGPANTAGDSPESGPHTLELIEESAAYLVFAFGIFGSLEQARTWVCEIGVPCERPRRHPQAVSGLNCSRTAGRPLPEERRPAGGLRQDDLAVRTSIDDFVAAMAMCIRC